VTTSVWMHQFVYVQCNRLTHLYYYRQYCNFCCVFSDMVFEVLKWEMITTCCNNNNDCIYIAILKATFNRKPFILSADITVPAMPHRPLPFPPCWRLNKCEWITYSRLSCVKKWRRRHLNQRPTDSETDMLTTQPPRLTTVILFQ